MWATRLRGISVVSASAHLRTIHNQTRIAAFSVVEFQMRSCERITLSGWTLLRATAWRSLICVKTSAAHSLLATDIRRAWLVLRIIGCHLRWCPALTISAMACSMQVGQNGCMLTQTSLATIFELPATRARTFWVPRHSRPGTLDGIEFHSLRQA